jgi:hypothetical protein
MCLRWLLEISAPQGVEEVVVQSKKSIREEYISSALRAICELMRSYGIERKSAERITLDALDRGFSDLISSDYETLRFSRLADVCARWHFESEFVDSDGKPKPLRWNGRSGNLHKLVKKVVGEKVAKEVIKDLISQHLVSKTRDGAWLPKSKVVPPSGPEQAQTLRSATMIERLLRTVIHNSELGYKGDVLLEVMAQVRRLPLGDSRRFKKFAKAEGVSFIKTVDDWLESRNVRSLSKKTSLTREAGVVAFAFMLPTRRRVRE